MEPHADEQAGWRDELRADRNKKFWNDFSFFSPSTLSPSFFQLKSACKKLFYSPDFLVHLYYKDSYYPSREEQQLEEMKIEEGSREEAEKKRQKLSLLWRHNSSNQVRRKMIIVCIFFTRALFH